MYQKYAPEVFRFALYLSGNHGEAEDIVSETFVRAWTSAEHIEMPTLRGYLFTIARNLFLHGRRKSSRNQTIDETLPDGAPGRTRGPNSARNSRRHRAAPDAAGNRPVGALDACAQ